MTDGCRYTMIFATGIYTQAVGGIFEDMEAAGYAWSNQKNYWSDDQSYRGINAVLSVPCPTEDDPNFAVLAELQIHTPESFKTKQDDTHEIYEEMRVITGQTQEDKFRRHALYEEMCDVFKEMVPTPKDVLTLGVLAYKRMIPPEGYTAPAKKDLRASERFTKIVEMRQSVKRFACALAEDAKHVEASVTAGVTACADKVHAKLMCLETRLKGSKSIARKISFKIRQEQSRKAIAAIAADVSDSLRYMVVFHQKTYMQEARLFIAEAEKQGFIVAKVQNFWHSDSPCSAVKLVLLAKQCLLKFEIQLHTWESTGLKNKFYMAQRAMDQVFANPMDEEALQRHIEDFDDMREELDAEQKSLTIPQDVDKVGEEMCASGKDYFEYAMAGKTMDDLRHSLHSSDSNQLGASPSKERVFRESMEVESTASFYNIPKSTAEKMATIKEAPQEVAPKDVAEPMGWGARHLTLAVVLGMGVGIGMKWAVAK